MPSHRACTTNFQQSGQRLRRRAKRCRPQRPPRPGAHGGLRPFICRRHAPRPVDHGTHLLFARHSVAQYRLECFRYRLAVLAGRRRRLHPRRLPLYRRQPTLRLCRLGRCGGLPVFRLGRRVGLGLSANRRVRSRRAAACHRFGFMVQHGIKPQQYARHPQRLGRRQTHRRRPAGAVVSHTLSSLFSTLGRSIVDDLADNPAR